MDKTYLEKIEAWDYRIVKNFIILTSTIFLSSTRVADGQIETRTDGRAIAYSALSICCRAIKNRPVMHFMSPAKKVCTEEARCHTVNESVLVWRERRRGGHYGRTTLAAAKPAKPPRKC